VRTAVRAWAGLAAALVVAFVALPDGSAAVDPSISFVTPVDGSTVAGPSVDVAVKVEGLELVEAGSQVNDSQGHAHILIDRDEEPDARDFLSTDDPDVVHLGKAPFTSRSIELDEGEHTLIAILGDSEHLVVDGQKTAKIRITVATGFRGKGELTPACADVAVGQAEVRIAFPSDGGTVQGTITATCAYLTNGGACTWTDVAFSRIIGAYDPSTHAFTGEASGISQRRLQEGDRGACGDDRQTTKPAVSVEGELGDDDIVTGNIGRARFEAADDDTVELAADLEPLTNAGDASASAPRQGRVLAIAAFAAAALLIAFAIFWTRRASATAR
jgi:hypothetical protein